jgi:multiple sugar transport system permease protein
MLRWRARPIARREAPARKRVRERRPNQRSEALWGYLLVAPLMLGWLVFFAVALGGSLAVSFTEWNILSPPKWTGIANYARLLRDPLFFKTLYNTFHLALLYVPLSLAISLALAVALNSRIRFRAFYRAVYFLPFLTIPVANATVWRWLYNPEYGLINHGLRAVGLPTFNWLSDPRTAMIAVVMMLVWHIAGYNMIIFLAGLQNIPREYYEAAQIDGAQRWQQFRHITLPLLSPTTFFLLIIATMAALKEFDSIFVMTQGGPLNSTRTIVYYIYEEAFRNLRMGYGTALSWVLFLLIFAVTLVQFRIQRRWVEYQ